MTTETKTTDFDTVRDWLHTGSPGFVAIYRIEASHSALVAALEGLLSRYTGGDAESGAIYVTKEIIETAQSALKTP